MPEQREPSPGQFKYWGHLSAVSRKHAHLSWSQRRRRLRRGRPRALFPALRHDLDRYDRYQQEGYTMAHTAPARIAESFFRRLHGATRGGLRLIALDVIDHELDNLTDPSTHLEDRVFAYPDNLPAAIQFLMRHSEAGHGVCHLANLVPAPDHESDLDPHIFVIHAPIDVAWYNSGGPRLHVPPSVIVHASPQQHHGYWRLDVPISPHDARLLCWRLTACLSFNEADIDDHQLLTRPLRVPGFGDPLYRPAWPVRLGEVHEGEALQGLETPFEGTATAMLESEYRPPRRSKPPRFSSAPAIGARAELATRHHWVAVEYVTDLETGVRVRDPESDAPIAIPLDPWRDEGAYLTNPRSWGPLRTALQRQRQARADGLGFVLAPDDHLLVLALDHCRDAQSKALTPQARVVVQVAQSFTTVTPDGTGLRLLLRRVTPGEPLNERYGRFALASTGLVPITEHTVSGAPDRFALADEARIAELRVLLSAFGAQVAAATAALTPPPAEGSPEAALAASRANEQAILAILANPHLTPSEKLGAIATVYRLVGDRAAGRADAEGAIRTPVAQLAQAAGCSVDAMAVALDRLTSAGSFRKAVRPGTDPARDQRTAVYLTPTAETVAALLAPFATFDPERPTTWGGRRTPVSCPDHPNASITRAWRCSQCGRLMDASGEAIDPQDADQELARNTRTVDGGAARRSLLDEDDETPTPTPTESNESLSIMSLLDEDA